MLELAIGTGRNVGYYPEDCQVYGIDRSVEMMRHIAPKTERVVKVQQMDAHHMGFEDSSFDTVVDTFGLCSYDDPVLVLKEMKRVCKPDGLILLLEHGLFLNFCNC